MIIERQQTKIAFSQIRTYAQRDILMPKIITGARPLVDKNAR